MRFNIIVVHITRAGPAISKKFGCFVTLALICFALDASLTLLTFHARHMMVPRWMPVMRSMERMLHRSATTATSLYLLRLFATSLPLMG